jgi:F0F1-type ATP synthase gamma subunit
VRWNTHRQQLIRQRAVAKASLTRMQTFTEAGDHKVNEIQVRFDDLPSIFNRSDTAQSELELSDDTDHSGEQEVFENQYYEVKAKFNELLHPVVERHLSRHSSPRTSL